MAKKGALLTLPVLVLAGVAIWWFFLRQPSTSAALAADVAGGKMPTVPQFGTDNIIDTADAIAATGSLPLSPPDLSAPSTAINSSQ